MDVAAKFTALTLSPLGGSIRQQWRDPDVTTDNDNSAEFTCPTCGAGGVLHWVTGHGDFQVEGVPEGFEFVVIGEAPDQTSVRHLSCRTTFAPLQTAAHGEAQAS